MRFPLYAKILFWFLLNLVALAVPAWLLFGAQLRPGLDSLLAGRAGDHIQSVADIITSELHSTSRDKWDIVLKRFSDAYHVRFYIFRNDGTQIAGESITLLPEVYTRITERPALALEPRQNPPPPRRDPDQPPPSDNVPPAPPPRQDEPPDQQPAGSDG